MANLPALHPSLTIHLTDRTATPIISSSSSNNNNTNASTRVSTALTSLTRSALASHSAAARFNLGSPVRIMVELDSSYPPPPTSPPHHSDRQHRQQQQQQQHAGPVVINSFIPPTSTHHAHAHTNGQERVGPEDGDEDDDDQRGGGGGGGGGGPGLLVGIVVAPDGEGHGVEARRAAARLERVGRELQACWVEERGGGGERE